MNMSDIDYSFQAVADHRRQKFQVRPPEPEGAPRKTAWPVVSGGAGKAPVFALERDKQGVIVRVVQLQPFPRSGDDMPENRGRRFEVECLAHANIGMQIAVEAGCKLDVLEHVAMTMYGAGTGKILKETRP